MTFVEKYTQLQDRAFLSAMLTETVFATMSLEDQQVPKTTIQEIVENILAAKGLETSQLNFNQSH